MLTNINSSSCSISLSFSLGQENEGYMQTKALAVFVCSSLNAFPWLIRLYTKFSLELQKFILQNYS